MKTGRNPYRAASAVLGGQKDWGDVSTGMRNKDIYIGQGTTAIALYYFSRGQGDLARKVIDNDLRYCQENSGKALLESMEYGSVGRALKPKEAAGSPSAAVSGSKGAAGAGHPAPGVRGIK